MSNNVTPLHPPDGCRVPLRLVQMPPYTSRQWTAEQRRLARAEREAARPRRIPSSLLPSRFTCAMAGFLLGFTLAWYAHGN